MRCKVGDLAVIIGGCNAGALVDVVRWEAQVEAWQVRPLRMPALIYRDDGKTTHALSGRPIFALDINMRPIRDQDGEDEMIRIATKEHA